MPDYVVTERTLVSAPDDTTAITLAVRDHQGEVFEQRADLLDTQPIELTSDDRARLQAWLAATDSVEDPTAALAEGRRLVASLLEGAYH